MFIAPVNVYQARGNYSNLKNEISFTGRKGLFAAALSVLILQPAVAADVHKLSYERVYNVLKWCGELPKAYLARSHTKCAEGCNDLLGRYNSRGSAFGLREIATTTAKVCPGTQKFLQP